MQTKTLPRALLNGTERILKSVVLFGLFANAGFDGMTLARSEREWAILVNEVSYCENLSHAEHCDQSV